MRELWNNPWVRLAALLAGILVFAWIVRALGDILFSLLLALIFAYVFDPVVDFFEARKLSRGMGIVVILGGLLIASTGFAIYVVPSMAAEVGEVTESIRDRLPQWQASVEKFAAEYADHPLAGAVRDRTQDALEWLRSKVPSLLGSGQRLLLGALQGTLSVVGFLTNLILFAVVAIYLLYDFDPLVAQVRDLVPHPYRARVYRLAGAINDNVRNFYRGQVIVCTILSVIYTTGLLIFDVPFAPLLGLVGGFGQLVPYVGTLLGAVPAVLLAMIEHHAWLPVVGAAGTFAVGQACEGWLITPKIVGDKVGLHPVAIILALLVFTRALGFVGLLLAVPLAAALKVLVVELVSEYRRSALYLGTGRPANP